MKFVRYYGDSREDVRSALVTERGYEGIIGDLFSEWTRTGTIVDVNEVKLAAPFQPVHIIGIGKNFVAEGDEVPAAPEMPILFFKPLTTVIGPEDEIIAPAPHYEAKFEAEIAVVIGKTARHITSEQALDHVFGYTIVNDVTSLAHFHEEGHWTVGKAFDTFCPLGPYVETELDLARAQIRARLNGELKQDSGLDRIIMSIPDMIAYISGFMTLQPGDVILSGTPAGAVTLHDGDVIECEVEGLGVLRNRVVRSE